MKIQEGIKDECLPFLSLSKFGIGKICLKYGTKASPTQSADRTKRWSAFMVVQIISGILVFKASNKVFLITVW